MHFLWKKLWVVRAVSKYSFIWALSGANLQTYGLRICHACSYISILKHSCRIILSHKGLEWLCMLFLTNLSDNLFFYLLKYLTFPHCMLCYLQFIHGTPSLFLVLFCAFGESKSNCFCWSRCSDKHCCTSYNLEDNLSIINWSWQIKHWCFNISTIYTEMCQQHQEYCCILSLLSLKELWIFNDYTPN